MSRQIYLVIVVAFGALINFGLLVDILIKKYGYIEGVISAVGVSLVSFGLILVFPALFKIFNGDLFGRFLRSPD